MRIRLLTAEELTPPITIRRAQREQDMAPYREVVAQLSPDYPGGLVTLADGETPRVAMVRLHRAAQHAGVHIRFKQRGRNRGSVGALLFQLQTPEETARRQEQGRRVAKIRHAQSA